MKFSQPWYRKSRKAWFVTLDGKQIKLGKTKTDPSLLNERKYTTGAFWSRSMASRASAVSKRLAL